MSYLRPEQYSYQERVRETRVRWVVEELIEPASQLGWIEAHSFRCYLEATRGSSTLGTLARLRFHRRQAWFGSIPTVDGAKIWISVE
ncbi:hypothetical protein MGG_16199 [Pyricularia oryzae 70-15]|uniref:Uncharacterized protein n=1 Tax=Pyricularia oryzae (strain 70-15 / ATCC MYA-4617 / FGSC 8958) TaxID=242507 RepID=G4MML0_PYRO7|nr:uncharacterized protein MGG_16199 [Pyricularia oryzae 70-15]EHA56988.1 hypothetical protein MGG_16199 [Pyricularia oryzae 70-15]